MRIYKMRDTENVKAWCKIDTTMSNDTTFRQWICLYQRCIHKKYNVLESTYCLRPSSNP